MEKFVYGIDWTNPDNWEFSGIKVSSTGCESTFFKNTSTTGDDILYEKETFTGDNVIYEKEITTPVEKDFMEIFKPFYLIWNPQCDISTYELAKCIPFMNRLVFPTEYELDINANFMRHFKKVDPNK